MNRLNPSKFLLATLFVIILVSSLLIYGIASAQSTDPTPAPAHWTYEGDEGPDAWGNLDENYALCATGRAQSPINVTGAEAIGLQDIQFNYQPSALNIFNNGHTIQANYDMGSSITYNETEYQLIQFHFHHPSEHTIDGKSFDMEMHLVHRDASGNLAVVGILLQKSDADNAALAPVFDHLPAETGDPQAVGVQINVADFLPDNHLFYTYAGSLTTPPCSQGVRWLLLETPATISETQLEAFASLFEMNARPVQPLNNRDLLEDNTAGE